MMNTILAGTAFNFKKMLNRIKTQILFIIFRIIKYLFPAIFQILDNKNMPFLRVNYFFLKKIFFGEKNYSVASTCFFVMIFPLLSKNETR